MASTDRKLILPRWTDPRLFFFVFWFCMATAAISTPSFARTVEHFSLSMVVCILTDLLLGGWHGPRKIFPMSAAVSSFGIAVFLDSPYYWPTALAAFLAMTSKQFLRIKDGHIFNPNNFGLTLVLFGLPEYATIGGQRFGGNWPWYVALVLGGLILTILADRWVVAVGYIVSFFSINTVSAFLLGRPWWTYSITLLAPALVMAIFFMITDPRTTPNSYRQQFVFAALVALFDHMFRLGNYISSGIYALFLVCAIFGVVRWLKPEEVVTGKWNTQEMGFSNQPIAHQVKA